MIDGDTLQAIIWFGISAITSITIISIARFWAEVSVRNTELRYGKIYNEKAEAKKDE
jgi:hypothetical protein